MKRISVIEFKDLLQKDSPETHKKFNENLMMDLCMLPFNANGRLVYPFILELKNINTYVIAHIEQIYQGGDRFHRVVDAYILDLYEYVDLWCKGSDEAQEAFDEMIKMIYR